MEREGETWVMAAAAAGVAASSLLSRLHRIFSLETTAILLNTSHLEIYCLLTLGGTSGRQLVRNGGGGKLMLILVLIANTIKQEVLDTAHTPNTQTQKAVTSSPPMYTATSLPTIYFLLSRLHCSLCQPGST